MRVRAIAVASSSFFFYPGRAPFREIVVDLHPLGRPSIRSRNVADVAATAACAFFSVFFFPKTGPRASLHFKPKEVRAAVVTCGGLCPGLNSVIHHIVSTLLNIYKADKVCMCLVSVMRRFFSCLVHGADLSEQTCWSMYRIVYLELMSLGGIRMVGRV